MHFDIFSAPTQLASICHQPFDEFCAPSIYLVGLVLYNSFAFLWASEIPPQVATNGFLPGRSTTTRRHGTVFPLVLVVVVLYFAFCFLIDDRCLQAINGSYKGNSLDAKAAAQEVLDQFGPERVQTVLAATVQDKDWDARFSRENKAWAQMVPMQEGDENRNRCSHWVVDSHPGLVNLLVDQVRDLVREQEKEKPSVIQQLRQEPAAGKIKAAPSKKQELER